MDFSILQDGGGGGSLKRWWWVVFLAFLVLCLLRHFFELTHAFDRQCQVGDRDGCGFFLVIIVVA